MVHVRVMRVGVFDGVVMMIVRVGFDTIPREGVQVLMVGIVPMRVGVSQGFVNVLMLVALR